MWTTAKRVRVPSITPTEALTVKLTEVACKAAALRTTGCKSQRLHERFAERVRVLDQVSYAW
jgi:hypothetical protein